jgi:hypothetical protein
MLALFNPLMWLYLPIAALAVIGRLWDYCYSTGLLNLLSMLVVDWASGGPGWNWPPRSPSLDTVWICPAILFLWYCLKLVKWPVPLPVRVVASKLEIYPIPWLLLWDAPFFDIEVKLFCFTLPVFMGRMAHGGGYLVATTFLSYKGCKEWF